MTVGQLVGRLVREALDRHDPSRRRPRTGSRRSQRHFDGTDPAGLRRPRRLGAEVTRFGPIQASHYGHARMDSRALVI